MRPTKKKTNLFLLIAY